MPPRGDLRGAIGQAEPFKAAQRKFGPSRPRRAFVAPATDLAAMVRRAEKADRDYLYEPQAVKAFGQFVEIPCRTFAQAHEVAAHWRSARGLVESVYVSSLPSEPGSVVDEPECAYQGHCDPAPVGIDARYAWTVPGTEGSTVNFIDIERGWNLTHPDLADHGIQVLGGVNMGQMDVRRHGTRVLGVVCAADNAIGCLGIAPSPQTVRVISRAGITGDAPSPTSNAIIAAVQSLRFGDVLLLETQEAYVAPDGRRTDGYTSEVLDDVFIAVRLATALGIIVIEAAGNAGVDLDTASADPWQGRRVLAPGSGRFRDSGAIIVGACQSNIALDLLRAAWLGTNHGARVNCFAWGNAVHTCDNDPMTGDLYTPRGGLGRFSGTSAAAAIIAGAAIAVQSRADHLGKGRLSPKQMRRLLSDPECSTASVPRQDGRSPAIGRMPDLKAILGTSLEWMPDVYLRDFVGDVGVPHDGPVSLSPDIIVTVNAPGDAQAAYGQGSGMEDVQDLGGEVIAGTDQTIYVRVRNRGAVAARNVVATVYHAEPSTLPLPDTWTRIGRTTLAEVPPDEQLTVSPPLNWPAVCQPGPGHYCFVATIHAADDPRPPLPAVFGAAATGDVALLLRYIRENNNVTWRNFAIVPLAPTAMVAGLGEVLELPFAVPGLPDLAEGMEIGVDSELPRATKMYLSVPGAWRGQMPADVTFWEGADKTLLVPLHKYPKARLPLPPCQDARHALRLLVDPAVKTAKGRKSFRVAARQSYQGREFGRLTWDLRTSG